MVKRMVVFCAGVRGQNLPYHFSPSPSTKKVKTNPRKDPTNCQDVEIKGTQTRKANAENFDHEKSTNRGGSVGFLSSLFRFCSIVEGIVTLWILCYIDSLTGGRGIMHANWRSSNLKAI